MKVLVDTNLLVRTADTHQPQHEIAANAIWSIWRRGDVTCLVPQNLYEFWVVCTRPAIDNGLGMSADMVVRRLQELSQAFEILEETPAFRLVWEDLVGRHNVQGKSAHDARLGAAMQVHSVTAILTFNKQHFLRFPGISIVSPEELPRTPKAGP